jgi:hypothetical protein
MAWQVEPGEEHYAQHAKSVRHAGFAGYVGRDSDDDYDEDGGQSHGGFDEDLWDNLEVDPTSHEQRHYDEHDEYPESYEDRRDQAYQDALTKRQQENEPDLEDGQLHRFVSEHGTNTHHWQQHATYGAVNLKQPVYATQSHVSQAHIDKYLADPGATSHHREKYGETTGNSNYLGDGAPMFVTHEGRLHATEGHHRTAAALQRGDSHIMGWHYDADEHGFPDDEGRMPDHPDYEDPDDW